MLSPLPSPTEVCAALWCLRRSDNPALYAFVQAFVYMEVMGSFSLMMRAPLHVLGTATMLMYKLALVQVYLLTATALYHAPSVHTRATSWRRIAVLVLIAALVYAQLQLRPACMLCENGTRLCEQTVVLSVLGTGCFLALYCKVFTLLLGDRLNTPV